MCGEGFRNALVEKLRSKSEVKVPAVCDVFEIFSVKCAGNPLNYSGLFKLNDVIIAREARRFTRNDRCQRGLSKLLLRLIGKGVALILLRLSYSYSVRSLIFQREWIDKGI